MIRACLLALLLAAPLAAQTAHVRVDAPAGDVLVDGAEAGTVGPWIAVAPGRHVVVLVDDALAWDPRRAESALTLADGDSVTVALELPTRVRVETVPIRGLVVRETAAGLDTLGRAPVTVDVPAGEAVTVLATLDGYEPVRQRIAAGDDHATLLLPLGPGTVADAALLPTQRSTVGRSLIDVGIGAAAIAAGAVAVHFKFRADAVDDRYRDEDDPDFADPALRDQALSLDRQSAVALGAMQLGLGVLALRFVLR